jgi:SulP family sulfate permease
MVLSGVQSQPLEAIRKAGFDQLLGPENIHPNIDSALARAKEILAALPAQSRLDSSRTSGKPGGNL